MTELKYYRELNKKSMLELQDDLKPCAVIDLLNSVLLAEGLKIKTNSFTPNGVVIKITKEISR